MRKFVLALLIIPFMGCGNRELKREIEMLREELAKQQQYMPLHRDTIRDSVEVVTQKIIEVQKIKEVLTDEDRTLLKDVGIKIKELDALQKTGTMAKDTVGLSPIQTPSDGEPTDTILAYKDAWVDFEYFTKNRRLAYAVRDSLTTMVRRQFKHKFLWWRWGVKVYELKVVNHNPHSTIRYNTVVKRGD